uniref:Uncharacterized protein n=1 Tax=Timspurckia oligopyrenoides TaxID=708627 RepID=A0A7S0ZH38_9RHOD|mmetsp:Transcript_4990/g.8667  ORF Transcript_4990/g.8667 Transcript_4990/m.8667 type:complete len:651 (+) Transcript_4990:113-2065(+)
MMGKYDGVGKLNAKRNLVVLIVSFLSLLVVVSGVWINEIRDEGSETTQTQACCVSPDVSVTPARILVFGNTNGVVGAGQVSSGTFDFFVVRYVLESGQRDEVFQLTDNTGDEVSKFLVVNQQVAGSNIVLCGTTTGTFEGTNRGGVDLLCAIRSNDLSLSVADRQFGTVGDDTMDALEVSSAAYYIAGTGKSSASAVFNNAMLLWIIAFNTNVLFANLVVSLPESNGFMQVTASAFTTTNGNRFAVATSEILVNAPATDVHTSTLRFFSTAGATQTAIPLPADEIPSINGFYQITSLFYDSTLGFLYASGQNPPFYNILNQYDNYCAVDGDTFAVFGTLDLTTLTFKDTDFQTIITSTQECGFLGVQVRTGVDPVLGRRALFGMDAFAFDSVPARFEIVYTTVSATTGQGGAAGRVREGVQDSVIQSFTDLNPIGAGAVVYGTFSRAVDTDPCSQQGPNLRDILLARFEAGLFVTRPDVVRTFGSLCDETITTILNVDNVQAVAIGSTKGSLVGNGNPLQSARVWVMLFETFDLTLPQLNPLCASGCVEVGSPTPPVSPSGELGCIKNSTHCTCRIGGFDACLTPSILNENTCLVGQCAGLECDCLGSELCLLERRADWIPTGPIEGSLTQCELFTTTYPIVTWSGSALT